MIEHEKLILVGVGGSLRQPSTSLNALERVLRSARGAGAQTEMLDLRRLELPMFRPGWPLHRYPSAVQHYVDTLRRADGMVWSTPAYHGTLAGITKNALDYLEYLAEDALPYLDGRAVGLIATAGGELAAAHAVRAMVDIAHALRGQVVPLMAAIPRAGRVFSPDRELKDPRWAGRLDQLGQLVTELAGTLKTLRADETRLAV